MNTLSITEIFGPTLQGEGIFTGTLSTFVRTAGCSVGCKTCDTKKSWPFSWQAGKRIVQLIPIDVIVDEIRDRKTRYVVLTGGEPMEVEDPDAYVELVRRLRIANSGVFITVELSGSVENIPLAARLLEAGVDLWSFSPKVASMKPVKPPIAAFIGYVLKNRRRFAQLKFVVDDKLLGKSLEDIHTLLVQLPEHGVYEIPPIILQTLTLPKDTPTDILARQRRVFDMVKNMHLDVPLGPTCALYDVRILPQMHALIRVP